MKDGACEMRRNTETVGDPSQEWMRQIECFTVARDGFHGYLHHPVHDVFPGKAIIVVGGSEGTDAVPLNLGRLFAERGLTALGVCYWNVPGLPAELVEVPLESIERAASHLREAGFDRVALYGISKGGELALLASSLIPDIGCAIALSPLDRVMFGITNGRSGPRKSCSSASSWTWRGAPITPFVPGFTLHKAAVIRRLVTERQVDLCWAYERALASAPSGSRIAVENIKGPVLLISPTEDLMWPSCSACKAVENRLREQGHPFRVKRLEYRFASHIMVPMTFPKLKAFRVERTHPKECAASRADAFDRTLEFLREW